MLGTLTLLVCKIHVISLSCLANSIKQRKPRLLLPPAERGPESSVTVLKGGALLLECFAEGL